MLQNIRDNAQGVIAKTIIGVIVVIFAAAGIDSLVSGNGANAAAEINGEDLSSSELGQAVLIQKRRLLESMGENADPSLLNDAMLKNAALEQLIKQKLLLQMASKEGISASPATIDQIILDMPHFQENGKFSPQLYENVLRNNGYSMSSFKLLLNNDLVVRQLTAGIVGSDFVTDKDLEYAARIIGQKRSYQYITLAVSDYLDKIVLNQDSVAAYYHDNIDQFQHEPKVKLDYIELKQADFIVAVEEADIEEAYQLEMSEFKASEERRASHILIEVTDKRSQQQAIAIAEDLKSQLLAGSTFAELAQSHSDDISSALSGGDLGYSQGDTFPEAFEEALFKLPKGVVSEPIVTDAGVHLILVTDIKGVKQPSYADRKEIIKQRLEMAGAEIKFVKAVDHLRDLVFNSADLSDPAKELKLEVVHSDWLGRDALLPGVLSIPKVVNTAFSDEVLKEKNNSEVLELASDHYIVVRVAEYQPAAPMTLPEVNDQIVTQLKQSKAVELLDEEAKNILQQLTSGEKSLSMVDDAVHALKEEKDVTRMTAKASREISSAIFALPKLHVLPYFDVIELSNGDRILVSLEEVVDGTVAGLSANELQAINAQLYRANSGQNFQALENSIRSQADITVF